MVETYDLVVIGSGTAAQTASAKVAKAGRRVAVIDERPFGGTCALRGCDPKKMLIAAAEAVDWTERMRGRGVNGDVQIDWAQLMAFKKSFTDPIPAKQEKSYAEKHIDALRGHARFLAPDRIGVNGAELEARAVLIASGAHPVRLNIPGEEHIVTSDDFLDLPRLPPRIVLIGGGFIAAEFGHIAARAGAKVTILEAGERILSSFDPDCVSWLLQKFTEIGVEVRAKSPVTQIRKAGNAFVVLTEGGEVEADLVVHAAGRAPSLNGLDLAAGAIATKDGRLELNEFLQSISNPIVYAAGDAAQKGPPLTPVSMYDARIAATNLLQGNTRKADYRGVASVAFTVPPIASVGLSEMDARGKTSRVRVNTGDAATWFTARREAEHVYGYKVIIEEDTDLIVGAHLVGPHAEEVINLFALAIRQGLTAGQLRDGLLGYPTSGSDIGYMLH